MKFCTAINCMDGRVQLPVTSYLKRRFDADYVDVITEAGPNRVLAEQARPELVASILARLEISVGHHHSAGIAVAGHHDCAGNPGSAEEQLAHTRKTVEFLNRHFPGIKIIGLWVNENWEVSELPNDGA